MDLENSQLDEQEQKKIYNYCLYLLNRKDYGINELKKKLKQKEYNDENILDVLKKLIELKYLDDARVAQNLITSYSNKKKSQRYIKQKLIEKGFKQSLIDELFLEYNQEADNAVIIAKKLLLKTDMNVKEEIEKYFRKMASRGFSYSCAKQALEIIKSESLNEFE